MKYLKLPSYKRLHELFEFNSETGNLIRKTTIKSHAKKGDTIKQKDAKGYLKCRVDGKKYSVHRMIYKMYHNKEDINKQIDHINGVRDDNRICNLRLVDQKENQRNASLRKDNTAGITGVHKTRHNTWVAYISNKALGTFKTKEEAVKVRKEAEEKMGYTKRHGKKRNSYPSRYIKVSERQGTSCVEAQ